MKKYTKENPLKVFTSFSGYDSQCMALDKLGIPYELVGWSEIDKAAIQSHNAVYPQYADRNFGDISLINWDTVPDFELFTYSSPCFEKGTLILTEKGYKPIEDITPDDCVLTHTNTFKKVRVPMVKEYKGMMVNITAMGFDSIRCTPEHPFYVRRMYKKLTHSDNNRMFHEDPEWIQAKNLDKNCYIGYAINTKSEIPEWNGSIDNRFGHHRVVNHLKPLLTKKSFWYLMGRYVGDGWKRKSDSGNSIIICCFEKDKQSLIDAISDCGLNYTELSGRTCTRIQISMNELHDFVSRYGYYAYGKKIDAETMNLPVDLLQAFVEGYVDSDGCYTQERYKTSTVSKELCYGIAQCVAKVYHRPFAIYKIKRKPTTIIEGREVNQKDTYNVVWKDPSPTDHAFYENGYIWYPLSKLPTMEECHMDVYNMSVEDDESYTANGAIVHNCQDFSAAGKQKGGEEGSGTRSSLLWECRRAILAKKPKYMLLENVKALTSQKFMPLFQKWIDELESYGYMSKWQILNSKDYGVPQNRERVFLVSILRTEDEPNPVYHFPKPFPLTTRLKDVLENKVSEEYYLKKAHLDRLRQNMDFRDVFKAKEERRAAQKQETPQSESESIDW